MGLRLNDAAPYYYFNGQLVCPSGNDQAVYFFA